MLKLKLTSNRNYIELPIDDCRKDFLLMLQISKGEQAVSCSQIQYVDGVFATVVNYNQDMEDASAKYTGRIFQINNTLTGDKCEICDPFEVEFNRAKIKAENKSFHDAEMLRFSAELARLDKRIDEYLAQRRKNEVPICDPTFAKKGMALMIVDDIGSVAFAFPLTNVITEINGKHAIDKKITISAEDIAVEGKELSAGELINKLVEVTKAQSSTIKKLSEELNKVNLRLQETEKVLVDFKANT